MGRYEVTGRREGAYWTLEVPGVGTTQGPHPARDAGGVADYVALLADDTRAEVVIVVVDPQARRAQQAQREVVEASNADAVAAQDLRTVVREMRTAGIGQADLASILSVSTQRVSQLAAAGHGTSALQERRLERAHDARGP